MKISFHYFERPDGQNTYLPISEPAIFLSEEGPRVVVEEARDAMQGHYDGKLKKELHEEVRRIERQSRPRKK